jgi:peptide/nickel transport system ATP-binding protein
MDDSVLSVRGLSVAFGPNKAVRAVDLDIGAGRIVGLTGDAGSGKSTLGLTLLGLAKPPGRITAGQVWLDRVDLLALDEAGRRARRGRDIGMITQNPRGALSPLHQIGDQIAAPLRVHEHLGRREAAAASVELLRSLGLNDPGRRAHAYPHEMSGGMAQRALIAMALGTGPKLLVADEPTSGLDVTIQAGFLDDMAANVRARGSAVLLITQDPGILANYCDEVMVMERGQIVERADVRQFFAAPKSAYSRAVLSLQREKPPADPAGATLLSVTGLGKRYPVRGSRKQVKAVSEVSFTIARGETLGLVGESGSGKTTVGRALLRLVPPDSGAIVFDGQDVTKASPRALRRLRPRMQIVLQDPLDSLDPRWKVGEIVAEGMAGGGNRQERVAGLLRLVDLDPALAESRPASLSAGAQQRVSIARSLASGPDLIVLDEPTSALTPLARVEVIRLLRRLQTERGLSYLFISHDLTTVEHLSHRVAVMYLGQVVEQGTRAQVFGAPAHPYTKALLGAHLVADPARKRVAAAPLSGEIPSPIDLPPGCFLASRCPVARHACATTPQPLLSLADGRQLRCLPEAG